MIGFNKTLDDLLNEHIDYVYIHKYLLESQGISKQLVKVQTNIYYQIKDYISKQEECSIYTGYNWNFNEQNFIKLNDPNKPYPLYIDLHKSLRGHSDGNTFRNIKQEKLRNTKITINISLKCDDVSSTLLHKLQHCREMYALRNKNVVQHNKTNVYAINDNNYDAIFKTLYHDILYMMSDAEQHAHLQQVYDYVYNNDEIVDIDIHDPELENKANLRLFYDAFKTLQNYKQLIINDSYFQELALKFGILLKRKFNYKDLKLTDQYVLNVMNNKDEFDMQIYVSILGFIQDKIIQYQRKVGRTIYMAIDDRNDEEND